MKLQFVAKSGDVNAETALNILSGLGEATKLLGENEILPPRSIALFTPLVRPSQGIKGRFIRCSSIKFADDKLAPAWVTTPFRVAVIRTEKKVGYGRRGGCGVTTSSQGLRDAMKNMAHAYKLWLADGKQIVPWSPYEKDPGISESSNCMILARQWANQKAVEEFRRTWIIPASDQKEIKTLVVGPWQVNFCSKEFVFSSEAVRQATAMLQTWQEMFKREQTWVQSNFQVPSLFIRLDCIVRDEKLILYEVEERPAGLGISSFVSPGFSAALKKAAEGWPRFSVKISPLRKVTDDALWQKALGWPVEGNGGLVLVRAEPEEEFFHDFESLSVSSVKAKGDKGYGERMGLWHRVSNPSDLPWEKCFVLKPLQGSKLKELGIWDPKKRPGSSVKSHILDSLKRNGTMFCQEFFDPMDTGLEKFPWMIFRIFFTYEPASKAWACLGGNWNARHNLRIHGASDAIFGPAVVG